jgi:hypothetical protein
MAQTPRFTTGYFGGPSNPSISDVYLALKSIINILSRPTWLDPTTGRLNINTVTTVSALGSGTTGPMKAEDVAAATGDQGIPAYVVRQDIPVAGAGASASGDYIPMIADNFGRLQVIDPGLERIEWSTCIRTQIV